jgi:hypothetical protein
MPYSASQTTCISFANRIEGHHDPNTKMIELGDHAFVVLPRLYPPCREHFPSWDVHRNRLNNRKQPRIHYEPDHFVFGHESLNVPIGLRRPDQSESDFVSIDHDSRVRITGRRFVNMPDLQLEQVHEAWFGGLRKRVHNFLIRHFAEVYQQPVGDDLFLPSLTQMHSDHASADNDNRLRQSRTRLDVRVDEDEKIDTVY